MNNYSRIIDYIGMTGIFLFLAGLLFSPALLSIATLMLLLHPILSKGLFKTIRITRYERFILLILGYFAVVALTGINTSDSHAFFSDLKVKLPFVVIGIASLSFEKLLDKKKLVLVFLFFELCLFITGLLTMINYLSNPDTYNQLIMEGKPIPVFAGLNHIYFSIMLAFGSVSGMILAWRYMINPAFRWVMVILSTLNIVILHLVGARTGLLGFYAGIVLYAVYLGFITKKMKAALGILGGFIIVGILAVILINPLHNRYLKTIEDYNVYEAGEDINHYSMSMRFEYWEKSFKVFLRHPVFGTGFGDVHNDMEMIFKEEHSQLIKLNRKGPHNQFLETLAGSGVVGFFFLLAMLFYPAKDILYRKDEVYLFFLVIVSIAFLFESILERQVGISFFTFFTLLLFRSRYLFQEEKLPE